MLVAVNMHTLGAALTAAVALCVFSCPGLAAAQGAPLDVLVVGGTPAGVAAAVAAARRDETVELIARRSQLGGILTDAMMDQWDLNLARDGELVEGGLFTEIYGRLGDSFTPVQAARTFRELVAREPRIHVVADAAPTVVQTVTNDAAKTLTGVTFRDLRTGRIFSTAARYVVDATDDGDVAALAGARYDIGRQDTGRDERMQPVTLMFTLTGVDWSHVQSAYDVSRDGAGGATERRAWGYSQLLRAYRPTSPDLIIDDLNLGHEDGGDITVNAIDVLGIDGRNDADLARARRLTQDEAPRLVAWLSRRIPGLEHARVGRYADAVYVRETRHFMGIEELTADDVWTGAIPFDTIGLSSYPIDLHPVTPADRPAFAPVRHIYGLPFGSLVPRGFANLIIASPAISASHLASGSARVIPTTIEEGEAAGAAAALAAAHGDSFAQLAGDRAAIEALRANLERHGVVLNVATAALHHGRV